MDRRRFLKYAGATAAVVGASALGLNYISPHIPSTVSSTTLAPVLRELTTTSASSSTSAPSITSTQSVQLASLQGRLFFDYNGNGVQDGEEPPVVGASVQLKDDGSVVAESLTDSSGDYALEDFRTGSYKLHVEADKKFRYMCRSTEEFRAISEGYDVLLDRNLRMDLGLMEGFLTLPLTSKTKYSIPRYYDWDPSMEKYLWWNGQRGFVEDIGGDANHSGVDFEVPVGTDVVALAPGIVSNFETGSPGATTLNSSTLGLTITHPAGDLSVYYGHLSRYAVTMNQEVSRGQKIAESGMTGAESPHLHINNYRLIEDLQYGNLQQLYDFYKPIFPLAGSLNGYWERNLPGVDFYWKVVKEGENSNGQGFWTKDNDPQYSA